MLLFYSRTYAIFAVLKYCRLSPGSGDWLERGVDNLGPQFCCTSFLLHPFSLSVAASLKGLASIHTRNSSEVQRGQRSILYRVTPGRRPSWNSSRSITMKGVYRPGYLGQFPLSLLPSTTPEISIEKCCQTHTQDQHMLTCKHIPRI